MSNKTETVKVLVSPQELREWRKRADLEAEGSLSRFVRATVNATIGGSRG